MQTITIKDGLGAQHELVVTGDGTLVNPYTAVSAPFELSNIIVGNSYLMVTSFQLSSGSEGIIHIQAPVGTDTALTLEFDFAFETQLRSYTLTTITPATGVVVTQLNQNVNLNISKPSLVVYTKDPTVTDFGIQLTDVTYGSGNNAGQAQPPGLFILPQGSDFIFRATSNQNLNNVVVRFKTFSPFLLPTP